LPRMKKGRPKADVHKYQENPQKVDLKKGKIETEIDGGGVNRYNLKTHQKKTVASRWRVTGFARGKPEPGSVAEKASWSK